MRVFLKIITDYFLNVIGIFKAVEAVGAIAGADQSDEEMLSIVGACLGVMGASILAMIDEMEHRERNRPFCGIIPRKWFCQEAPREPSNITDTTRVILAGLKAAGLGYAGSQALLETQILSGFPGAASLQNFATKSLWAQKGIQIVLTGLSGFFGGRGEKIKRSDEQDARRWRESLEGLDLLH